MKKINCLQCGFPTSVSDDGIIAQHPPDKHPDDRCSLSGSKYEVAESEPGLGDYILCPKCGGETFIEDKDGVGFHKGSIASHTTDPLLEYDGRCNMSGVPYEEALKIHKPLPGPRDWGVKYEPEHQRDIHNPAKPAPR